jgi:hypothetical protein
MQEEINYHSEGEEMGFFEDDIETIFQNILEIRNVSSSMLSKFYEVILYSRRSIFSHLCHSQAYDSKKDVSEVFLKFPLVLDIYSKYCAGLSAAQRRLKDLKSNLVKIEKGPLSFFSSKISFLIRPSLFFTIVALSHLLISTQSIHI